MFRIVEYKTKIYFLFFSHLNQLLILENNFWSYYDPINKEVVLFVTDRHPKDVLRSLAHEFIHHNQFEDKRITPDMCDESEITKNNKIVNFEEEAYLKGNIAFRTWTELENNKN